MPTPRVRTNLPILLRADGRREILFHTPPNEAGLWPRAQRLTKAPAFDAAAADPPPAPEMFKALGYRQTMLSAAKGGKANANGFRIRNGGMRALGRSFRGQTFITGHNKGDTRARGGTIRDSYTEELAAGDAGELGIIYEIEVQAAWALEGLANGTIDRFSFGIAPKGEITCTVHGTPVFEDCWCCPGDMTMCDGKEVIAEWELEDADGLELSAVNVPAVDGTGILAAAAGDRWELVGQLVDRAALVAELAVLCGREYRAPTGGDPAGGFRHAPRPITMATPHERSQLMDRALICQQLGLPVTATDDEIKARIQALGTDAAQVTVLRAQLAQSATEREAERDAAHVEAGITTLRASHQVSDEVVAGLRAAAAPPGGRAAFDAAIALVRLSANPIAAAGAGQGGGGTGGAAPTMRAPLQSDAKPAPAPSDAALEDGPDAFEANRNNPNLGRLMKWAQITPEQVRQHGSRQFTIVPNLRELADATATRP